MHVLLIDPLSLGFHNRFITIFHARYICFKKGWRAGAGDGVNSACIKRG